MAITALHSYLVHPAKSKDDRPKIGGAKIKHEGKLFDMLKQVYEKSDTECNIDISFNHNSNGEQQNDCRDLVTAYASKPSLPDGRKLAQKLQAVTTGRSGLGLLFLMAGKESNSYKLVVSRFPADSGILAEQSQEELTVEFIEKIFMKSATSYKAALYKGTSLANGFWDGKAIDKQINAKLVALSDYWIKDFLESDFKTTAAAGTKRLANAIRAGIKETTSLPVKGELVAAARLIPSLQGTRVSMSSVAKRFSLSDEAKEALKKQLPNEKLFTEQFSVSKREFEKHIAFESAELDNGGILMAPAGEFRSVFKEKKTSKTDGEVEFSTTGHVVDRKLRKTKT